MGIKYIVSQKYVDPELGRVNLRVLATAVRYSARWKSDGLHITVPPKVTAEEFTRVIDGWRPKLLSLRPQPQGARYYDGFSFETFDWKFSIRAVEGFTPHYVGWEKLHNDEKAEYIIKVSPTDDLSTPSMERTVAKVVKHIASELAPSLMLPLARAEADRLGLSSRVKSWCVGRGQRRMGACKSTGHISLSLTLMFFPEEVRRATITHELAHLTHFDHSPAFHALWRAYFGKDPKRYRPDPAQAPIP